MSSKIKTMGFVETPEYIAEKLIDNTGCVEGEGSILELACGKGAIARVLLRKFIEKHGNESAGREEFNNRVTLIELDTDYKESLESEFPGCRIIFGDALTYNYGRKFDYIISNPPYIRIHNLSSQTKDVIMGQFSEFCTGMYDLYQAFYMLGIKLLDKGGKLSYIAPNSWITTSGTRPMREWFSKNRIITDIEDFGSEIVFKGVGTYTAIVNIQEGISNDDPYPWEFGKGKNNTFPVVLTGVATLRDKLFFGNDFDTSEPVIKPALKASTGENTHCIYPYDEKGNPISEEEFKTKSPKSYEWLKSHSEELNKRSVPEGFPWYLYGRSQGLKHMMSRKVTIAPISKEGEVKHFVVEPNVVIYSGMFIPDVTEEQIKTLSGKKFLEYVDKCAGHKSGGYRTLSARDLKNY